MDYTMRLQQPSVTGATMSPKNQTRIVRDGFYFSKLSGVSILFLVGFFLDFVCVAASL